MITTTPHSMYIYPQVQPKSTVINLFGGPGCGKSTLAAGVFAELKRRGCEAELVPEYAKKCVWTGTAATLDDQLYVFAKQHHMIQALENQVDYIIVDSPLLLSTIYGETSDQFKNYVVETHNRFNNYNIFVQRNKPWHPKGRVQTEDQALSLDNRIRGMLYNYNIDFDSVWSDTPAWDVVNMIMRQRNDYV